LASSGTAPLLGPLKQTEGAHVQSNPNTQTPRNLRPFKDGTPTSADVSNAAHIAIRCEPEMARGCLPDVVPKDHGPGSQPGQDVLEQHLHDALEELDPEKAPKTPDALNQFARTLLMQLAEKKREESSPASTPQPASSRRRHRAA